MSAAVHKSAGSMSAAAAATPSLGGSLRVDGSPPVAAALARAAGPAPQGDRKVKVRIKAPLNTSTGTRKVCLKPDRNTLGMLPDMPAATAPGGGGRRPPPGEVLDNVSWKLSEQDSSRFETCFSGSSACIERCLYLRLYSMPNPKPAK